MGFGAPLWFLLLVVLVPLLLLYMLRRRRKQVVVPSTLIWRRVLEDMTAQKPLQRLRRNIYMLLQIGAVCCAALAAAEPLLRSTPQKRRTIAIIIDTSASMKALNPDGRSRFETALAAARSILSSLTEGDSAILITAAATPHPLTTLLRDRLALEAALEKISPTDVAGLLAPAVRLAESALKNRPNPSIYLLTDGATQDAENLTSNLPLIHVQVAKPTVNRAVVAFSTRRDPKEPETTIIFARVRNYDERPCKITASVETPRRIVAAEKVSLAPRGTSTVLFRLALPPGRYILRLTPPDAFPLDDVVYFVVRDAGALRVAFFGDVLPFIARALEANPAVTFVKDPSICDLLVCGGKVPEQLPPSDLLVVAPRKSFCGFSVGEEVERPEIVGRSTTSPLVRFCDFYDLQVGRARPTTPPAGGEVVLGCREGALIATLSGARRITVIGFLPSRSNWPLLPSFPIFFANLVAEARTRLGPAVSEGLTASPIRIRPTGKPVVLATPDGRLFNLDAKEGATFTQTLTAGFYRVRAEHDAVLALNLLDERESDITPHNIGEGRTRELDQLAVSNIPFWWVFALAVFVLLVFEFYAYHRRLW